MSSANQCNADQPYRRVDGTRYGFEALANTLATHSGTTAIVYFNHRISYGELDRDSDALAAWLGSKNVGKGDRVCIVTQNVPHFVIALLAIWKCGAVAMPCNPMYTETELTKLFEDAGPSAVFVETGSAAQVEGALQCLNRTLPILTVDPRDFRQTDGDRPTVAARSENDFLHIVQSWTSRDVSPVSTQADDPAVLLYTSGTTGRPKGAILTFTNLLHNAEVCRKWFSLDENSVNLAVAPLFHIIGLVCTVLSSLMAGGAFVLNYRFNADQMLDAIRANKPTFTIGAITVFSALLNNTKVRGDDFESFQLIYSGGAPIPVELAKEFQRRFGKMLHPSYGMTETAAPTHFTPAGQEAPVDPISATQSVGLPVDNTYAKIVDDDGRDVPPNTPGELLVKGPQIMAGYWNRPAETEEALAGGWMHTGDIAIIDENNWCYIVDRKKDMICASGFKIWPREVEEILYALPGVREAVVVGKPDDYRGETVKAYLSLTASATLSPDEVKAFVREKLAAYKCPTEVEILQDLPKTATGKLQRVVLREKAARETKETSGAR